MLATSAAAARDRRCPGFGETEDDGAADGGGGWTYAPEEEEKKGGGASDDGVDGEDEDEEGGDGDDGAKDGRAASEGVARRRRRRRSAARDVPFEDDALATEGADRSGGRSADAPERESGEDDDDAGGGSETSADGGQPPPNDERPVDDGGGTTAGNAEGGAEGEDGGGDEARSSLASGSTFVGSPDNLRSDLVRDGRDDGGGGRDDDVRATAPSVGNDARGSAADAAPPTTSEETAETATTRGASASVGGAASALDDGNGEPSVSSLPQSRKRRLEMEGTPTSTKKRREGATFVEEVEWDPTAAAAATTAEAVAPPFAARPPRAVAARDVGVRPPQRERHEDSDVGVNIDRPRGAPPRDESPRPTRRPPRVSSEGKTSYFRRVKGRRVFADGREGPYSTHLLPVPLLPSSATTSDANTATATTTGGGRIGFVSERHDLRLRFDRGRSGRFALSVPLRTPGRRRRRPPNVQTTVVHFWKTLPGQLLHWEGKVLQTLRTRLAMSNAPPDADGRVATRPDPLGYVPKPIGLFDDDDADGDSGGATTARGGNRRLLGLRLQCLPTEILSLEGGSAVDVLGTLDDVVRLCRPGDDHPRSSSGHPPRMPEAVAADLASKVLDVVSAVHGAGVVHNDLGLVSFLVARRRSAASGSDHWFLQIVGFGPSSVVLSDDDDDDDGAADPSAGPSPRDDSRRYYESDLRGVANVARALLAAGTGLGDNDDDKELASTWEELFDVLRNEDAGLHELLPGGLRRRAPNRGADGGGGAGDDPTTAFLNRLLELSRSEPATDPSGEAPAAAAPSDPRAPDGVDAPEAREASRDARREEEVEALRNELRSVQLDRRNEVERLRISHRSQLEEVNATWTAKYALLQAEADSLGGSGISKLEEVQRTARARCDRMQEELEGEKRIYVAKEDLLLKRIEELTDQLQRSATRNDELEAAAAALAKREAEIKSLEGYVKNQRDTVSFLQRRADARVARMEREVLEREKKRETELAEREKELEARLAAVERGESLVKKEDALKRKEEALKRREKALNDDVIAKEANLRAKDEALQRKERELELRAQGQELTGLVQAAQLEQERAAVRGAAFLASAGAAATGGQESVNVLLATILEKEQAVLQREAEMERRELILAEQTRKVESESVALKAQTLRTLQDQEAAAKRRMEQMNHDMEAHRRAVLSDIARKRQEGATLRSGAATPQRETAESNSPERKSNNDDLGLNSGKRSSPSKKPVKKSPAGSARPPTKRKGPSSGNRARRAAPASKQNQTPNHAGDAVSSSTSSARTMQPHSNAQGPNCSVAGVPPPSTGVSTATAQRPSLAKLPHGRSATPLTSDDDVVSIPPAAFARTTTTTGPTRPPRPQPTDSTLGPGPRADARRTLSQTKVVICLDDSSGSDLSDIDG